MDDDIDFEIPSKKASARKGRRARNADLDDMPNKNVASTQEAPSQGERPTRRVGGWGDEEEIGTSAKAKSGRRRGETMEEMVDTRFTRFDDDDGSDTDIPVIPDLEDSTTVESTSQVAIAPSVAVNKVTSYQDLDKDLQRAAQFSIMDGEVDLKLLTHYLVSEADASEDDKMWHWDHLFTEVSSELQAEWDAIELENNEMVS